MDLPYSVAEAFSLEQSGISDAASAELRKVIGMLDWGGDVADVELSRDAVVAYMQTLVQRFGDAAAANAAETFEVYAEAANGGRALKKTVDMAEVAPIEDIASGVHFAAQSLFNEDAPNVDAFATRCCAQLTRYIHSASNRTMADAGAEMYARVLGASEHGSCPLCEEWAALEYVWKDDDMVEPHDGCQCSLVPGFGRDPKIVGKDDDKPSGIVYQDIEDIF